MAKIKTDCCNEFITSIPTVTATPNSPPTATSTPNSSPTVTSTSNGAGGSSPVTPTPNYPPIVTSTPNAPPTATSTRNGPSTVTGTPNLPYPPEPPNETPNEITKTPKTTATNNFAPTPTPSRCRGDDNIECAYCIPCDQYDTENPPPSGGLTACEQCFLAFGHKGWTDIWGRAIYACKSNCASINCPAVTATPNVPPLTTATPNV